MKLGPVTKLNKRNKTTSKNFDDDVMPQNCDVFSFFLNLCSIWRNPEAGFRTQTLIFSLIITFYLTITENRTKKSLTQLSH